MAKNDVEKDDKKQSVGKGRKKIVILVAAIIILGIIAVLYEMYGSLPTSLLSAMNSGKPLNSTVISSIMFQKVASMPSFQANYTGNITINSDPLIIVGFQSYGGMLLAGITTSSSAPASFPLGNFDLHYDGKIQSNQSNPISVNQSCFFTDNPTLANQIKLQPAASSVYNNLAGRSYGGCQPWSNQSFADKIGNLILNISSISNVNITSYGVSSYAGIPCYDARGSGNLDVNSTLFAYSGARYEPAKMEFNACLSAQYNMPVYLGILFIPVNGGQFELSVTANYMGAYTNPIQQQ